MQRLTYAIVAVLIDSTSPLLAHDPAAATPQPARLSVQAREAAAAVDAFHEALRRGDAQSAAALLADDVQIFEEGSTERTKAEYAARHLPADAAFSKVVPTTVTRRTGGANGNVAWIMSEGRITGTYNGKALNRATTETMVLRGHAGVWKIVHIHWSSGPAQ